MILAGDEGGTRALASGTRRVETPLSEMGKAGLRGKIQNSAYHMVFEAAVTHARGDSE